MEIRSSWFYRARLLLPNYRRSKCSRKSSLLEGLGKGFPHLDSFGRLLMAHHRHTTWNQRRLLICCDVLCTKIITMTCLFGNRTILWKKTIRSFVFVFNNIKWTNPPKNHLYMAKSRSYASSWCLLTLSKYTIFLFLFWSLTTFYYLIVLYHKHKPNVKRSLGNGVHESRYLKNNRFELTQSLLGSNGWCSCDNLQLGQTIDKIAVLCQHVLVYKHLYGRCRVVLIRSLETRNRSRRACHQSKIAAKISKDDIMNRSFSYWAVNWKAMNLHRTPWLFRLNSRVLALFASRCFRIEMIYSTPCRNLKFRKTK